MIILTCGHVVNDFKNSCDVKVKTHSRDFQKAVSYQTVCQSCKSDLEKENLLLDTEYDVNLWLSSTDES